jgi:hypothetical protein
VNLHWWRDKARGRIFEAINRRWPEAGDFLFVVLFPREVLDQRKRDKAVRARFNAFCKTHGMTKVNGHWVKKTDQKENA